MMAAGIVPTSDRGAALARGGCPPVVNPRPMTRGCRPAAVDPRLSIHGGGPLAASHAPVVGSRLTAVAAPRYLSSGDAAIDGRTSAYEHEHQHGRERAPVKGRAQATAHGRAAFAFILITMVLDALAFGIAVPIVPRIIAEFQAGDAGHAAALYGLFGSAWAAMQFLCSPLLGALSDRFGRRPVILLSNLGLGLDYLLVAAAPTLAWLFLGRVISGISSATYGTAAAYVADVTPADQRAARFGLLGVGFGIGFIVGPSAGGLLSLLDLRAPFWCAAALSLANAAYGFFILPESLPPASRAPFTWRRAQPLGALRLLRAYPRLLTFAIVGLLSKLAHDALPSTFVLYADHRYGWDGRTVGLTLAAIGLCSVIVQAGLVKQLVSRAGERWTLALGLVAGAAGMLVIGLAPSGIWLVTGVPFIALWGLAAPALQALMTRRVGAEAQGALQGAIASLHGMASMGAPLVFTHVFAAALDPALDLRLPGLPFLLAAALLLIATLTAWRVTMPARPPSAGAGSADACRSTPP